MMQDVEVTRMFHFSFPSSFNCSLVAQLEMKFEGCNNSRRGSFLLPTPLTQ